MTTEQNIKTKPKIKEPLRQASVVEEVTTVSGSYSADYSVTVAGGSSPVTPARGIYVHPMVSDFSQIAMRQATGGVFFHMPEGKATRSLRQTAVLQLQQQRGNACVQRLLLDNQWQSGQSPRRVVTAPQLSAISDPTVQPQVANGQVHSLPPDQQGNYVQRGLWGWIKRGAKRLAKGAKELATKGAKWAFEKALGASGVPKGEVMGLINRAGSQIMHVIQHPGQFINNIIRAISQGFSQFKDNIGKHLKTGLMSWLFGTMGEAGIQLPKDFSSPSILSLVLQVLGITTEQIKGKLAKHIGAQNIQRFEAAWEYISTFMKGGLGGLWELLQNKLSNLKEVILEGIKDWLITQIIKEAVLKVLSMFNPVSGLITIIRTIYNVIKFLVEQAAQIKALFQAITGSVVELVMGNIGAAANKVEMALARLIPVVIGFLASLLNISGIVNKIKDIIQKIRKPIDKAIDWIINKVKTAVKKIGGKLGLGKKEGAEGADAQNNENARKKAREQVAQATQKPFKDEKELRSAIKGIETNLIPEGLKSLTVTAKQGQMGQYDVIAREDVGDAIVGEESDAIKTKALDDAGQKIRLLERADQIPSILQAIEEEHRSKGLKSLSLEQDGTTGIKIVAKASEPKERSITWDQVLKDSGTGDFQKAQQAFAASKEPGQEHKGKGAPTVTAMVTVDGQAMGPPLWNVPGGAHAEDLAIAQQWPAAMAQVRSAIAERRHTRVVFAISASPCGRCSSNLRGIMKNTQNEIGEQGRQYVEFILAPRSLYEGSAMPHEGANPAKTATAARDLKELSDLGWDIQQFVARNASDSRFRFHDQPLAQYANYLWERASR